MACATAMGKLAIVILDFLEVVPKEENARKTACATVMRESREGRSDF